MCCLVNACSETLDISLGIQSYPKTRIVIEFLRGGVKTGRGCSWGTLRIPFGKIGEP